MKTLREWRTERLLSTRKLAELAGTSNKTIIQAEYGRQVPSFATIAKICRALDVSPREVAEFAKALETRATPRKPTTLRQPQLPPETTARTRVFCVSASLDVLSLVQRLLETGQYDVTTMIGNDETFDAILVGQPDVVIVELEAGDSFGWDLLERLRSDPRTSAIPVVVRARNAWLVERSSTRAALGDAPVVPATHADREFNRLVATMETLANRH